MAVDGKYEIDLRKIHVRDKRFPFERGSWFGSTGTFLHATSNIEHKKKKGNKHLTFMTDRKNRILKIRYCENGVSL
ncbi:MAG: hypothetical protein EBU82_02835 [Flavobacteriia bacterium]|nr:hypothetical protein [Flavobacteriia bacterium]NBP29007.1 hypothetical protein [Flavobacteriia bacterium]